jgi:hypothetical protein
MPSAASTTVMPAKTASSTALKRVFEAAPAMRCRIGWLSVTITLRFTARICCRTVCASAPGSPAVRMNSTPG